MSGHVPTEAEIHEARLNRNAAMTGLGIGLAWITLVGVVSYFLVGVFA